MATIKFFAVEQETEKAVKLLVRTSDYDLEAMKAIKSLSLWIPKSVVKINGNTAEVADWFYNKNIAVDTYASFMKSLANS
jgi:hypothetical protein